LLPDAERITVSGDSRLPVVIYFCNSFSICLNAQANTVTTNRLQLKPSANRLMVFLLRKSSGCDNG
jgi:hypothetical protein